MTVLNGMPDNPHKSRWESGLKSVTLRLDGEPIGEYDTFKDAAAGIKNDMCLGATLGLKRDRYTITRD